MPDAGSRAWLRWALAALTVYTALLVSLAFPLSRQINPDGVACRGRRYLESGVMRACLVVAAAVSVLGWSMEIITPDLLLAVLLTYYFWIALDPATAGRAPRAFVCG